MNVINLSTFDLNENHVALLSLGLSFSLAKSGDEFEIYKDFTLFLWRVLFKSYFQSPETSGLDELEMLELLRSLEDESGQ